MVFADTKKVVKNRKASHVADYPFRENKSILDNSFNRTSKLADNSTPIKQPRYRINSLDMGPPLTPNEVKSKTKPAQKMQITSKSKMLAQIIKSGDSSVAASILEGSDISSIRIGSTEQDLRELSPTSKTKKRKKIRYIVTPGYAVGLGNPDE